MIELGAEDRVHILVVDDLATQRLTIEAALAELDEHVVSVGSGREALKYLLDNDAAVILLDVNMPDMDGFETAALIRQRQRTAHTPIIFLTADTDELQAMRGYALGAVDYLFCPFLPEVLRTKVRVFVQVVRVRERIRREAEQRIDLSRAQAARAAAEDQSHRLRFLAEASGVLTRLLDGEPFVDDLLGLFVPIVADMAALVLRVGGVDSGESTWVGAQANGTSSAQSSPVPHAGLSAAIASSLQSGEVATVPAPEGGVMGIAFPLTVRGSTYGTLGTVMTDSGRRYSSDDIELIEMVTARTAVALDNRRLFAELQERDRRKDEFLAMLSHELRNPLGAISTAVRVLELVDGSDERAGRARGVIERQSLHLTRMVDDLLEVSRVTAGRITLVHGLVNLRELVDRAVDAVRSSGRVEGHRLHVSGPDAMVEADDARMEQVITNLLVNALKYTDPGGEIAIAIEVEGGQASVSVKDSGIGIGPDLLPHVFDIFVQGRQTLARAEGGLGLGLALVRKLVLLQGGTVDVTSEGVGKGSTFVVRLPCSAAAVPVRAPEPDAPPVVGALRVLLVEDHQDARDMMRSLLALRGHEVFEAVSGPAAVEMAREVKPHLALVDLGLPGFDGFEVARRIRDSDLAPPPMLVAITGYGQAEDRQRTLDTGFDAHLVKPITPEHLAHVLERTARRMTEIVET
jgi:signal transduction histidine kinase/DNA-binding response OmpR family regulator